MIDSEVGAVEDREAMETMKQELEYLRSRNEQMMKLMKRSKDTVSEPVTPPVGTPEIDINSNDILTKNVGGKRFLQT